QADAYYPREAIWPAADLAAAVEDLPGDEADVPTGTRPAPPREPVEETVEDSAVEGENVGFWGPVNLDFFRPPRPRWASSPPPQLPDEPAPVIGGRAPEFQFTVKQTRHVGRREIVITAGVGTDHRGPDRADPVVELDDLAAERSEQADLFHVRGGDLEIV